ncbi:MAG: DsbA family protein [Pseudooceanicola atlanticus]
MDRRIFMAGGAAAVVVAAGGAWYSMQAPGTTPVQINQVSGEEVDTSDVIEMTLGDENAPVTMIEYASFTCPHCANFHDAVFKDLKADYIDTGKVRFVYRDVYFDQFGLWAAMVARCEPTRFFGISDMLYTQQRDWIGDGDPAGIADRLRKIGLVAGLDNASLDACLADEEQARKLVAWFQKNSTEDDVTGTPTLIIDGEKHSNMNYGDLKAILDAKLES